MKKKIHPVLLKRFCSFSEWEKEVETIPDTTKKGDAMELLVFFYLKYHSHYYDVKEVYREQDIPKQLREQLKLERKDNGVDGIIVRNDGKFVAYQVKFRSKHNPPTAQELSTFWAESEYADMRLICANCSKLPKVSSKKKNQMSLLLDRFMELDEDFFDAFLQYLTGSPIPSSPAKKAAPTGEYQYQQELIDQIAFGLSQHDRGKFIAACGVGKTLIALWVQEAMNAGTVLFVVPGLALIRQTLDSWMANCNIPFRYLCVCSDPTVTDTKEDVVSVASSDMDFPVTTAPSAIQTFLTDPASKKVLFSTYQSLDAVANAITGTNAVFDLGIFDESHRTAGTKDSLTFIYGMDDRYIPIKKRLFMTATERLISPRLKQLASQSETMIFSMDDTSKYGPVLASLNFGQAIEKGIICDYKIVVCTITEQDLVDFVSKHRIICTELGTSQASGSIDILLKEILIAKVIKELDVKKVISYHAYVKNAKAFITGGTDILSVGDVIDAVLSDTDNVSTYTGHINGAMPASERKEILSEFSASRRGLLSNARCLTEGVDVPAIDAVYFADPKNSMIDIVQAVGRALRKSPSKKDSCSYIVLPIVIPDNASLFSHIAPSSFDTLHTVIQAMRSQDASLADMIDEINFSAATGTLGRSGPSLSSKIMFLPYSKIRIHDFEHSLTLRIAEINKNPSAANGFELWIETLSKNRKSEEKRVFTSIGDYTLDSYLDSLILPTLKKFSEPDVPMDGSDLKCGHNNVSHAVRMGALSKNGRSYSMTPLGKALLADKSIYPSAVKEQLLKYFCMNKETGAILFPYRALLKIFLSVEWITRFEFLYCVYSLRDTDNASIEMAIDRIQYLRRTYPNITILSEANKERVLQILNTKYEVHFGFKDIWTSKTTAYNQFNYFKKHLWAFHNIFIASDEKEDRERIRILPGSQSSIQQLLELTSNIERAAASGDLNLLNELYGKRICSIPL